MPPLLRGHFNVKASNFPLNAADFKFESLQATCLFLTTITDCTTLITVVVPRWGSFNFSKMAAVMLQVLGKKYVLISSFVLMTVMFVIVMFIVNPLIDGGDGFGVLQLQLSFDKNLGIEKINSWGEAGVDHFNRWIFTDYIYALAYSLFLASLTAFLVTKKGKGSYSVGRYVVSLAFASGVLDSLENTMELFFINKPYGFSESLFFLHSIVALLKWTAVAVVIAYIIALLTRRKQIHAKGLPDAP